MARLAEISCGAVDIGMIVYNERPVIERSLRALLEVGFDSFVVLDMQSQDGTTELLRDLLGAKVKLVDFPRRGLLEYGYGEARNVCAAFSGREWLLFVDADEVLIGGVDKGTIGVKSHGSNATLFSLERRNLAPDREAGPNAIKVGSIENHNRLYRPSLRLRYEGYIHEEIFVADRSGHLDGGKTALVFDHYCDLKPVPDAEAKAGLYAMMLMRIYNQPDIRKGTNPFWYDEFVPAHKTSLQASAVAFAARAHLPRSFFEPLSDAANEPDMDLIPTAIAAGTDAETSFAIENLRTLHSMPCAAWTGSPDRALWGEWNHPGESSRTLTSIVDGALACNWHRFIKPGRVSIDIGGHSGDTALPMALLGYEKATRRRPHVVIVEPNPAVMPVLIVNLAMNTHLGEFFTLQAAVTKDDVAEIELADHGNAQCNGGILRGGSSRSVSERLEQAAGVRYMARGISMESLFTNIRDHVSHDPIGFIKIDCEGYDKEIIKPCRELFATMKPVVFLEWFDWFTPEDDDDLFAAIRSIDYVAYHPLTLQPADRSIRVSDLLCLHMESTALG